MMKKIQKINKSDYNQYMSGKYSNDWFIVFDGTSNYGVLGADLYDEINDNDVEIVEGGFDYYPEDEIEDLNKKAYA